MHDLMIPLDRLATTLLSRTGESGVSSMEAIELELLSASARDLLACLSTVNTIDEITWTQAGGAPGQLPAAARSSFIEQDGADFWVKRTYAELLLRDEPDVRAFSEAYQAREVDEVSQIYHALAVDPTQGIKRVEAAFEAALARYDYASASTLLRLVNDSPRAQPPEVARIATSLRVTYGIRAVWAWYTLDTLGFVKREETTELLNALRAESDEGWLFQLKAAGGMGKTHFIHYAIGHHLAPTGIPCVLVDFDYVQGPEHVLAEPWRLLLYSTFEFLVRQLPRTHFASITGHPEYPAEAAIVGRRDAVRPVERPYTRRSEAFGRDAESLFCSSLRDALGERRVVFVFDTLERAVHGRFGLEPFFAMLDRLHEAVPTARVLLSGRFDMREVKPAPPALERAVTQVRPFELGPLSPTSSSELLEKLRLQADPELIDAIVRIAGGLPWFLVRIAGMLKGNPDLDPATLSRSEVSLGYAVDRVLTHVSQKMQWAVLYLAALRRVDFALFEAALLAPIRGAVAGQRADLRERGQQLSRRWSPAEPGDEPKPIFQPTDVAITAEELWAELRGYAEEESWAQGEGGWIGLKVDVADAMRLLIDDGRATAIRATAMEHLRERDDEAAAREWSWCAMESGAVEEWLDRWADGDGRDGLADEVNERVLAEADGDRGGESDLPVELWAQTHVHDIRRQLRVWPEDPPPEIERLADRLRTSSAAQAELPLIEAGLLARLAPRPTRALGALEAVQGEAHAPRDALDVLAWRARALQRAGRPASRAYDAAVERARALDDPMSETLLSLHGLALEADGRWPEASALYADDTARARLGEEERRTRRVRVELALGRPGSAAELMGSGGPRALKGAIDVARCVVVERPSRLKPELAAVAHLNVLEVEAAESWLVRISDRIERARLAERVAAVTLFDLETPRSVSTYGVSERTPGHRALLLLARARTEAEAVPIAEADALVEEALGTAPRPGDPCDAGTFVTLMHFGHRLSELIAECLKRAQTLPPSQRLLAYDPFEHLPSLDLDLDTEVIDRLMVDWRSIDGVDRHLSALRMAHVWRVVGRRADAVHELDAVDSKAPAPVLRRLARCRDVLGWSDAPPEQTWLLEGQDRFGQAPARLTAVLRLEQLQRTATWPEPQIQFRAELVRELSEGLRGRWFEAQAHGTGDVERLQEASVWYEKAGLEADARRTRALAEPPQSPRQDPASQVTLVYQGNGVFAASGMALPPDPEVESVHTSAAAGDFSALANLLAERGDGPDGLYRAWLAPAEIGHESNVRVDFDEPWVAAMPWEAFEPLRTARVHRSLVEGHGAAPLVIRQVFHGEGESVAQMVAQESRAALRGGTYRALGASVYAGWDAFDDPERLISNLEALPGESLLHLQLAFGADGQRVHGALQQEAAEDGHYAVPPEVLAKVLDGRGLVLMIQPLPVPGRVERLRQMLLRNAFVQRLAAVMDPGSVSILALDVPSTSRFEREQALEQILTRIREGGAVADLARDLRHLHGPGQEDELAGSASTALWDIDPDRTLEVQSL